MPLKEKVFKAVRLEDDWMITVGHKQFLCCKVKNFVCWWVCLQVAWPPWLQRILISGRSWNVEGWQWWRWAARQASGSCHTGSISRCHTSRPLPLYPPPSALLRAEAPPTGPPARSPAAVSQVKAAGVVSGWRELAAVRRERKETRLGTRRDKMLCHCVMFGLWLCLAERTVKSLLT